MPSPSYPNTRVTAVPGGRLGMKISLTPELKTLIEDAALQAGITQNKLIEHMLQRYTADYPTVKKIVREYRAIEEGT